MSRLGDGIATELVIIIIGRCIAIILFMGVLSMSRPAKYIVTKGPFDDQTNNIKIARQELKRHVEQMNRLYGSKDVYSIYMLVESKSIRDYK